MTDDLLHGLTSVGQLHMGALHREDPAREYDLAGKSLGVLHPHLLSLVV
jgi:hypothetical protein